MVAFFTNFFTQIGDFFSKIWDFLVFIWEEITTFFKMISPALKFFTSMVTSLPPVFYFFGIAMLAVLILYVILGRTAGGD